MDDHSEETDTGTRSGVLRPVVVIVIVAAVLASLGTSPPTWTKSAEADSPTATVEPGYLAQYQVDISFDWDTDDYPMRTTSFSVRSRVEGTDDPDVRAVVRAEEGFESDTIEFPTGDDEAAPRVSTPRPSCDETCSTHFDLEVTNYGEETVDVDWTGSYRYSGQGDEDDKPDGEIHLDISLVEVRPAPEDSDEPADVGVADDAGADDAGADDAGADDAGADDAGADDAGADDAGTDDDGDDEDEDAGTDDDEDDDDDEDAGTDDDE